MLIFILQVRTSYLGVALQFCPSLSNFVSFFCEILSGFLYFFEGLFLPTSLHVGRVLLFSFFPNHFISQSVTLYLSALLRIIQISSKVDTYLTKFLERKKNTPRVTIKRPSFHNFLLLKGIILLHSLFSEYKH